MKLKFSKQEQEAVCALFEKCDVALIKVSVMENGEKHIDKVYLDGKEYDIPSKELAHQLYMSAGAVDLIREKGSILNLTVDERNFVIRNHPAWMMFRDELEFNDFSSDNLYGTAKKDLRRPYEIWCHDYCDSMGEKKFYPKKNMKSLMVTYEQFVSLLKMDRNKVRFPYKKDSVFVMSKNSSLLYRGFFEAARIKALKKDNLKVELNKYGYPEVYYLKADKWIKLDITTSDGLNKLFELSPSPLGNIETKENVVKVKKRPTKGSKKNKR